MNKRLRVTSLILIITVILVFSIRACNTVNNDSLSNTRTIFAVSEKPGQNVLSQISQLDWSYANKMIIQGYELEYRPIFVVDMNDKTILPFYLNKSILSSWSVPKLSRDGNYLAFQSSDGVHIASMEHIISHNYTILPESYIFSFKESYLCNLDWSSNNALLVSICLNPNGIKISLYELDGKRHEDLYQHSEDNIDKVEDVSWSLDETKIAFTLRYGYDPETNQRSQTDIFIYRLGTDDLIRFSNSLSSSERNPEWYPGSEVLTFTITDEGDIESRDSRLAFSTSDGNCIKLLPDVKGIVYPSWSPDGSQLAYIAEGMEIKVVKTSEFVPPTFLSPRDLCELQ